MSILVLLRTVLDPAGFTVNRRAQKIFVNRSTHLLNPSDRNALEAALVLAEAGADVIALACTHQETELTAAGEPEDVLRQALALGAGRALLIVEPGLQHADAAVIVSAVRGVVNRLNEVDLILLGTDVLNADLGQVGSRLAAALEWPFIAEAQRVTLAGDAVQVIAPGRSGFHTYEAARPAVVAVTAHSNKPRYAPGANLINAFRANEAIEILTGADLGLAAEDLKPLVAVHGESFPPEPELGKLMEGSPVEAAAQMAERLRQLV